MGAEDFGIGKGEGLQGGPDAKKHLLRFDARGDGQLAREERPLAEDRRRPGRVQTSGGLPVGQELQRKDLRAFGKRKTDGADEAFLRKAQPDVDPGVVDRAPRPGIGAVPDLVRGKGDLGAAVKKQRLGVQASDKHENVSFQRGRSGSCRATPESGRKIRAPSGPGIARRKVMRPA